MSKKNILFVINNLNIGGPQKSLLSLLYRLDYSRVNVSLLILNGEDSLSKYLPEEVKLLTTPELVKFATLSPSNFMKKTLFHLFSRNFMFPVKAISVIAKGLIQKNMTKAKQKYWLRVKGNLPILTTKYDVAIGVSGGHSMMYVVDCVNADKKIGWIRTDYRILGRDNNIDAKYFSKVDKIISVSKICKDIFNDIFTSEKEKVQVMYNVLPFEMYEKIHTDTTAISKEEEYYKLLTISRLDPHKGIELAINTLGILVEKGHKVKWFILGEGEYRKKIEKLIKSKGLQKNFIMIGFQFNTAAFIRECDMVVHPSEFEGKSNVVDEAKYLLKPIVATNYNTVTEQLSHEQTALITDMDSESLSKAIEQLLVSDELKEKFKNNLLRERYNDSKSIKTFYNIIGI